MTDRTIRTYIEQLVKEAVQQNVGQQQLQSSRTNYVIANWKMNKTLFEMVDYLQAIQGAESASVVICPPTPLLYPAQLLIKQQGKGSQLQIGAQNVHVADQGAFTGETSARMLKDVGCEYVIVGHSERRQYAKEDDEAVNQKIKQAYKSGLTPIICIGETLQQRNDSLTEQILTTQLLGALKEIDSLNFIVAYEPVWAIGTGESATPEQAEQTHAYIRAVLTQIFGKRAEGLSILYGGSVNESNAKSFAEQPDIDGVLVGGASLEVSSFEEIIAVFAKGDVGNEKSCNR